MNTRIIYSTRTRTALMLLMAMVAFGGPLTTAHAQTVTEKYTLTNGRLWWFDGTETDSDDLYPAGRKIPIALDTAVLDGNGNPSNVYISGEPQNTITHIVERGEYYLALDTSAHDPSQAKVIAKPISAGFTPNCAWSRTGVTGYYYQEWVNPVGGKSYRSYIIGTKNALEVYTIEVGAPNEKTSIWFNWDFGAAITNVTYHNGVRAETNHWLYYDDQTNEWKMSGNSYERPETIKYGNYTGNPAVDDVNRRYYYGYQEGGTGVWKPYGNGALFLPVQQIVHGIVIDQSTADPNVGLTGITLGQDTLLYAETTTAEISIVRPGGTLTVPVRPAYTEYVETEKRVGIHLDYRERSADAFGSAGSTPTTHTYRYKNGQPIAGNEPPSSNNKPLAFEEVTYSINASARRILEMKIGTGAYTTHPITTTEGQVITLHCYSVPTSPTATLTAVVKYSFDDAGTTYYVYDTTTTTIHLNDSLAKRDDINPTNAPVVLGYVCGGGRMANVGYDAGETDDTPTNNITGGNPKVTIHNSDSIYAIYGGNDIAGWVQGSATIQVGSLQTIFDMPISYVYGGGCGYYSYSSAYDLSTTPASWASETTLTGSVAAGNYCFGNGDNSGKVYPWRWNLSEHSAAENEAHVIASGFGYAPYTASTDFQHGEKGQGGSGTVPYIKSSHVVIGVAEEAGVVDAATAAQHNDLLHLDTVFGGAENAFIGVDGTGTASTAITVDVHGGSIMAVFGGNNYGGAIAQAAHVYTTVHNTKTTTQQNIENTYFTGYGRDFGIRHLYGGGNLVESAHAEVRILGGMTDTCFVGGNQASVVQPIGTINCRGDKFIYDNPSLAFTNSSDPNNYVNLQTWSTLDPRKPSDTAAWNAGRNKMLKTNPGAVVTETGRYNVRVFFGGNNKADMANLSYIHLASGGVEYVYGGGNQGDMVNTTPYNSPFYRRWAKPLYPLRTAAEAGFDSAAWVADGWTKVLDFGDSVRGSLSGNGWEYEMPGAFGSMVNAPQHSAIFVENIYGGCRMANVLHSSGLSLSGGVFGYVQGGCDISGDVGSTVAGEGTWVIIDSNALVLQDVYGGSDGYYHCHDNNTGRYLEEDVYSYADVAADYYHEYVGMLTPTQNRSNLYINGGNILYSAYGGGVMCDIGYKNGNNYFYYSNKDGREYELTPAGGDQNGSIHFQMNAGTVGSPYWHYNANLLDGEVNVTASALATKRSTAKAADELANHDGNMYGGGYLSSLYGLSYFHIKGGKVYGSVFAGNDCMGSVNHFGRYSTPAQSDPNTFAASDGTLLNAGDRANFASYLLIEGQPRIANVYGGGNGAYNYHMPDRPEYSDFEPVCMNNVVDNRPVQHSSFIDIHTNNGAYIDTVFGGGNGVGVSDIVRVLFNVNQLDGVADVGTIFGGNNRDDMTKCVPIIDLRAGVAENVYGGGNAGSMRGSEEFEDVCLNKVENVSTYVKIQSTDVTINQNVFGGCRMADVENMAYVDIRGTNDDGVQYVYGGNDIAGTVYGNTRVDVSGGTVHNIWGGSNGYYQYQTIDPRVDENVYAYDNTSFTGTPIATHTTGEPYVDSATVNLFGGTIKTSVYGGGRMGDVRATTVVVDNQACTERPLTIEGAIYGGGEGNWAHLDQPRRGNTGENTTRTASGLSAAGATHVHLKSATNLTSATAYGGGRGGDAYNTYITLYPTWTQPFNAIYGGCWGSDVKGHTNVILDGVTQPREATVTAAQYTARNVYGGNDFTGNVYASNITVNSGTYGNIYGAGDGFGGMGGEGEDDGTIAGIGSEAGSYSTEYEHDTYGEDLTVPNTEYVHIDVNDCRITGNLYGGGKLGTTFSYQKDASGAYVLNAQGKKIADTSMTTATAYADPEKYSYIIVNVHGGVFDNNIFAGGSGRIGGNPLVYGLKMLNMEGGVVGTSIYGGSANVSDGYGRECVDKNTTTKRPSSVINMTAGTIGHSVYGGGYKGVIRGSAYINVGIDAIDKCELWNKTIQGQTNAYALFKPGADGGHVPALAALVSTNLLTINQSIYAGPNWGNSSGMADFSAPGVFGGETRIFVDGNGYNTGGEDLKPTMYIIGSIIGAGTSTAGGDLYSRIDVRNYGQVGDNCRPTRELKAIQRAHGLWLNNTAILYTGSTDAINAYLSNQITLNRLDTLNTVGYNVIDVNYAITNIGEVNYYNQVDYPYYPRSLAENAELHRSNNSALCNVDNPEYICDQLDHLNKTDNAYTALVVNDGINIDFIKPNGVYSEIHGFAYLLAPKNSSAVVTAAPKYGSTNDDNGGFITVCDTLLRVITSSGSDYILEWGEPTATQLLNEAEYPYYNYSSQYRVWTLGNGTRRRFAVVQAHSNPDKALADNKKITLEGDEGKDYNLAIAHSTLTLPPTKPGHYYRINEAKGVDLTDENEEMHLVDKSYLPVTWLDTLPNGDPDPDSLSNEWGIDPGTSATHSDSQVEPAAHGEVKALTLKNTGVSLQGIDYIYKNSNTHFGLMMVSGANFERDGSGNLVPPNYFVGNTAWYGGTTLSGNSHVNVVSNFSTAKVGANENVSPELDLYMLYDNRFSHTILGTVTLQLDEYDENGVNLNKPIEVEITLSTVLEEFTDMEYEVLAMYNEGRTNMFERKVVLPATLQTREVYLEGITWAPTDNNGNWLSSASNPTTFYMTDRQDSITGNTVYEANRFGMELYVTDNVSNTLTTSVGWHIQEMTVDKKKNLYTLAGYNTIGKKRVTGTNENAYFENGSDTIYDQKIHSDASTLGEPLGTLDGRGEAAVVVRLNFDGSRIYPDTDGKGYVGKVVMHLVSYNSESEKLPSDANHFDLTVYVKTRAHGDTIYLATAQDEITRNGITMHSHSSKPDPSLTALCGKNPDDYLHTFQEAFTGPYQEGDVIAILDEVVIPDNTQVFIKGEEYMPVQVIRYSGHHHSFPGEKCAYRGTMIRVDGDNAAFTSRCIDFNGSMLTKTKPKIVGEPWDEDIANIDVWITEHPTDTWDGMSISDWVAKHPNLLTDFTVSGSTVQGSYDKFADTLKVVGPIIAAKNGATVTLQNGTVVEHNYNIYKEADHSKMGAISVTGGSVLNLINNVTIKENLSMKLAGDTEVMPLNGAVYVDGGSVWLQTPTSKGTATVVNKNLQLSDTNNNEFYVLDNINIKGLANAQNVHYSFNEDPLYDDKGNLDNSAYSLANVYLTRKELTNDLTDQQSDLIYISSLPNAGTKIGISKWFPGPTVRDTIQVVFQSSATQLKEAVYTNNNFSSDDGYNIFYNYGVNTTRAYLHRCATFNYQQGTGDNFVKYIESTPHDAGFMSGRALDYHVLPDASCPTGGDTLLYRLQGGFFPYTYTWYDQNNGGAVYRTRTTTGTDLEINNQVKGGNFNGVRQAVVDSLVTPPVNIPYTEPDSSYHYKVSATDVTGFCTLTKDVYVKLVKDISDNAVDPMNFDYDGTCTEARWSDNAGSDPTAKNPYNGTDAKGIRTYKAIKITPYVSPNSSYGNIVAAAGTQIFDTDVPGNGLQDLSFCEGDVIRLATAPKDGKKFVMWDFSPFYSTPTTYVVPSASTRVIAYYSPADYWVDVVNDPTIAGATYHNNYYYTARPSGAGYVTLHNGDVHIYNENGLAWFISVVNGLNGAQARPFFFNNVYLHDKDGGYDMEDHKWTPVGTQQHRFRGRFLGVSSAETDTARLADGSFVSIKHLIVDEPDLNEVGMFAFLDSATVQSIKLEAALMRGAQYVGTLAAKSVQSKVLNVAVIDSLENESSSTTILTTHHVSGGMVAQAEKSTIDRSSTSAKYVGNAVYSGGMVGYSLGSKIKNSYMRNINLMDAVYLGGAVGYADQSTSITPSGLRGRKSGSDDNRTFITNNYVHTLNQGHNQRVGGLVGYAKNTVIENNYVYGNLSGDATEGGVGAVLDEGSSADYNYYASNATSKAVGQTRNNAVSTHSSAFSGSGNQVTLENSTHGVNNLTRTLNLWVRAHGSDHRTWRSDLEGVNHGYPVFGTPDMIPVSEELTVTGCDSVEWDGTTYLFDDEVVSHIVDSALMVDSTHTLHIVVHHSTREQVSDSVDLGSSYSGYGFYLTATEVALLRETMQLHGSTTIVLSDTLQSALTGCDSIITLQLSVNSQQGIVETPAEFQLRVYPNPTTSRVTIEATEAISHVELYDNEGRRLQDYNTRQNDNITIDVSHYPTGAYYLRVHTADNVTIQKLIKK